MESYAEVGTKNDFMLTPIPFRLWPVVGHLSVRLKHRPHSVEKICECLLNNDISILKAEVTRSTHRYAVWNLTIFFEFLKGKKLHFNKSKSVYIETEEALNEIKNIIKAQCKEVLFPLTDDAFLKGPIIERLHPGLSYFYYETEKRSKNSNESWIYKPFQLKCNDDYMLVPTDQKKFNTVLDYLTEVEGKEIWPTLYIIASMDTGYLNIRLAFIPPEKQHTFFTLYINYTRTGNPDTSKGLLYHIVNGFPLEYNIWRLWNHTELSLPEREEGSIGFVIEDRGESTKSPNICIDKANINFNKIVKGPYPKEIAHLTKISYSVKTINEYDVSVRFERRREKKRKNLHDVFISYSDKDRDIANHIKDQLQLSGLNPFMAEKGIKFGEHFPDELRRHLKNSMQMCLVFTQNGLTGEWVKIEAGAAWVLDKKIVPILIGTDPKDLPPILQTIQAARFTDIKKYVRYLKEDKFKEGEFNF